MAPTLPLPTSLNLPYHGSFSCPPSIDGKEKGMALDGFRHKHMGDGEQDRHETTGIIFTFHVRHANIFILPLLVETTGVEQAGLALHWSLIVLNDVSFLIYILNILRLCEW